MHFVETNLYHAWIFYHNFVNIDSILHLLYNTGDIKILFWFLMRLSNKVKYLIVYNRILSNTFFRLLLCLSPPPLSSFLVVSNSLLSIMDNYRSGAIIDGTIARRWNLTGILRIDQDQVARDSSYRSIPSSPWRRLGEERGRASLRSPRLFFSDAIIVWSRRTHPMTSHTHTNYSLNKRMYSVPKTLFRVFVTPCIYFYMFLIFSIFS